MRLRTIKRFFCKVFIAVALSALEVSGRPYERRGEAIVIIALPEPFYPPRAIPLRTRFLASLGEPSSVNLHNEEGARIGNRRQG